MLLACVLVIGIVYFIATLLGDLLTAALNPRIRLSTAQ
jgi:ABC-type dipeptide/oligopeptide/nickel transport system permease component